MEIFAQDAAKVRFGRAGGRAVVVGQVEVRDAAVKRPAQDGATVLQHIHTAEVVPQTQREGRELQAAVAAAAVGHFLVAGGVGLVWHG